MDDEDAPVAIVSAPRAVVEETPVVGAEAAVVAEPELIRKVKPDEEGAAAEEPKKK
ncbi:hypothetical protein D3C83_313650 [compost metagenome]